MKLKDFDFRVWSKKENKYINRDNLIGFKFSETYETEYKSDDLEIELSTGLCDKNHRKIYEGDILGFYDIGDYNNCSVFYNKDEAMFVAIIDDEGEKLTYSMPKIIHAAYGRGGVEVVGNIHEPKFGVIRTKG